jgi:glycosyltransferase involved in cell wall biosynthesis
VDAAVRLTYLVDSPTYGGAERSIVQLLSRLPAGFVTTVVASSPVPAPLAAAAGDRILPIPGPTRSWRLFRPAVAALRRIRPDLVHVNCIDPRSNRALLAAARASGAPAVATVHMTGDCGAAAQAVALGRLYRGLEAVIAVSDEIRSLLVDRLGVPEGDARVITNGVEPAPLAGRVRDGAARDGDGPSKPLRVGGVGRLTGQKGWDVLVEATRRLTAEGTPLAVTVAGDGRDRASLEARAAGLPVEFVGFRHDVGSFLTGLDVFCLPSRAEGLPLALLEALMAGLPAVTTTVGAIPEAVGTAAVLVPPGDPDALAAALRRLARDPAGRRRLGARAAAVARDRFDVSRTVAEVAAVYAEVLGPRPAGGPGWRAATVATESGTGADTESYTAWMRAARASQW